MSNWEEKEEESIQSAQKTNKQKNPKIEGNERSLWLNFKHTNICWKDKREQEIENLLEKIMIENFPNLVIEIDIQDLKTQTPKKNEPKYPTPRYIQLKCQRLKTNRIFLKI